VRDARATLAAAAAAAAADVAAVRLGAGGLQDGLGIALVMQDGRDPDLRSPSAARISSTEFEGVETRWQLLSQKIGKRIGRIHLHKLQSAMGEAVGLGGASGSGARSSEEAEAAGGGAVAAVGAGADRSAHPKSRLSERTVDESASSIDLHLIAPIGQVRVPGCVSLGGMQHPACMWHAHACTPP